MTTCAPGGSVKNCTLCWKPGLGAITGGGTEERSGRALSRLVGAGLGSSSVASVDLSGSWLSGAVASGALLDVAGFLAVSSGAGDSPTGLGLDELSSGGDVAGEVAGGCVSATAAGEGSALRLNKYFWAPNSTSPIKPMPTSSQTSVLSNGLRGSASSARIRNVSAGRIAACSMRGATAPAIGFPAAGLGPPANSTAAPANVGMLCALLLGSGCHAGLACNAAASASTNSRQVG